MGVNREDIAGPLREQIMAGDYAAGDKLPSTRELAVKYNSARATANAALQQLAREGLIALRGKSAAVVVSPEDSSPPETKLATVRSELQAIQAGVQETRLRLDELEQQVAAVLSNLRP